MRHEDTPATARHCFSHDSERASLGISRRLAAIVYMIEIVEGVAKVLAPLRNTSRAQYPLHEAIVRRTIPGFYAIMRVHPNQYGRFDPTSHQVG